MRRRILVVDDEADMVAVLRDTLEGRAYQVIEAYDGKQCMEKAAENDLDLVILDIRMPVKDGFEALRSLREDERTKKLPVIMLTAKADIESIRQAEQDGSTDYLIKPVSLQKLLKYIEKYVGPSDGRIGEEVG